MRVQKFLDISLLQIGESFLWNLIGRHKDIPYFILLVGDIPEIIKCFKRKLPLAAFRSVVFHLSMDSSIFTMQSAMMYYLQHLLTLTRVSFSPAYKILEKVP
jgi:hypothetical protein